MGRAIATNADSYGVDPFMDVMLPEDGEYFIALNDLSYRGGYPYRLVVSNLPHVELIFPAAVQAGTTANLTAFGRNLGAGSKPSSRMVQDLPLDELSFTAAIGTEELANGAYRFRSHPTHHSVLPTAATATLLGRQVVAEPLDNTFNAQPMLVTDQPVTLEVEPNDQREKPQPITLPAVVAKFVRGGQVRLAFRAFEFVGPDSAPAAAYAWAAAKQNRLHQFAKLWYLNQGDENSGYVTDAFAGRIAGGVAGIKVPQLIQDAKSVAVRLRVQRTSDEFKANGFSGTPSFLFGKTGSRLESIELGDGSPQAAVAAISGAITPS